MENIPIIVLFAVSMAACLLGGLVRTYYSKSVSSTMAGYHLFNAVTSLVCGATLLALSGGDFRLSLYTVLTALLFGVITALQQVTTSAALNVGPWSYTSVIASMSTVITALSGALFFGESIRTTQYFGIALMLVCLVLSVAKESGEQKKKTVRWFLLCMVTLACIGGVGLMQKIHQSSDHREELTMFLIIAFLCSFAFSSVNFAVLQMKKGEKQPIFARKIAWWLLGLVFVGGGVGIALNNLINLYLSGVVASAVFFPIVNGGGLVLITLASVLFFRERLAPRQWLGLASGLAATLLLCL